MSLLYYEEHHSRKINKKQNYIPFLIAMYVPEHSKTESGKDLK